MHELLLKGGTLIDPAQGISARRDIGIAAGKIAEIAPEIAPGGARKVIDARGRIVTPGLIDMHAHVADGLFIMALAPDTVGVVTGVTTVCDAGSSGCANFAPFRRYVISRAQTDVLCFLHLSSAGLIVKPEVWCWQNIDREAMLQTIADNRDIIKGIKMRATGTLVQSLGVEAVRRAKQIAAEAGLPLMVHLGVDAGDKVTADEMNAFTRQMLTVLDMGDILTHVYQWKPGGVFQPDGSVFPEFREAVRRGVVLDVGQSRHHCSYQIARKGIAQGFPPATISTDMTHLDVNGPTFSLPVTMSRFLALGLSLEQVVGMTTASPARVLGEAGRRGSLRVGMPADVAIIRVDEGEFTFADTGGEPGKTFKGDRLLVPELTLKSGVEIAAEPRFG